MKGRVFGSPDVLYYDCIQEPIGCVFLHFLPGLRLRESDDSHPKTHSLVLLG